MLYLLFVLTFLCGILFYGFSPHDKQLDMSVNQAEGMIVSFLNQHQAARDYLYTWLGASSETNGNLQGNGFLDPSFIEYTDQGLTYDMCDGNTGVPGQPTCRVDGNQGPGFVSRVLCTQKCVSPEHSSPRCILGEEADLACSASVSPGWAKKKYVVTYGGWEDGYERPNWWPSEGNHLRRFESWRRSIAKRTRDSISCGVLYWNGTTSTPNDNNWCIDNGKMVFKNESTPTTCMSPVSSPIIAALHSSYGSYDPLNDMFFCMSEVKEGLGNYVSGMSYFYDGLANIGLGKHQTGEVLWKNLVNNTNMSSSSITMRSNHALATAHITTNIPWSSSYTLTVIASIEDSSAPLFRPQGATSEDFVFGKEGIITGTQAFVLKSWVHEPGADEYAAQIRASACNMDSSGVAKGIISWTFVVEYQPDKSARQIITVYENATKRNWFSGEIDRKPWTTKLVIGGSKIYGIRYYSRALNKDEIQQNFKVDQKRFSIPDINNGGAKDTCVNEDKTRWDVVY